MSVTDDKPKAKSTGKKTAVKKAASKKSTTKKKTAAKASGVKAGVGPGAVSAGTAKKSAAKKKTAAAKAKPRKNASASVSKSAPRRITPEERWRLIAENAYLRAEARGFLGGKEVEDWLAAEAEIDGRLSSEGVLLEG